MTTYHKGLLGQEKKKRMIKTDKNISSTYKDYKKRIEDPVDIKTYRELNKLFLSFIIQKVQEGHEVFLPARMGSLMIVGTKREKIVDEEGNFLVPPDWVKTKKLWETNPQAKEEKKLVYHLNEETGGVSYRYRWSKYNVPAQNKKMVSLRMTRKNKRDVNVLVSQKGKEYLITKTIKNERAD